MNVQQDRADRASSRAFPRGQPRRIRQFATDPQIADEHAVIEITYDSLGRKTKLVDPDSGPAGSPGEWHYAYDAAGRLRAQDDPEPGQSVHFCYDLEGRLTDKVTATSDTLAPVNCASPPAGWARVHYTYDTAASYGIDRLHRVTGAGGADETVWSYDPRGLPRTLAQTVDGRTATFTYENYDPQDRLLSVRYPDCETVTTRYDATGQPAGLTGSDVYITAATYDVFGRPRRLEHSADPVRQVIEERTYHPAGAVAESHRLAGITVSKLGQTHAALAYPDYSPRGFLERIVDTRDGSGNLSAGATFTYDDLGRLLTLDRTATGTNPDEHFAYDALGNMRAYNGMPYAYQAAKPHQVAAVGGTPLAYGRNVGNSGAVRQFGQFPGAGPAESRGGFRLDAPLRPSEHALKNCPNWRTVPETVPETPTYDERQIHFPFGVRDAHCPGSPPES